MHATFSGPVPGSCWVTVPLSGPTTPASVTFHLQQGPTIGGMVRRADTNTGVGNVSLFLYNTSANFVGSYFTDNFGTVGQIHNGPGLPNGTYRPDHVQLRGSD